MSVGQYRLVRFVPDPARDEPLNIGIVMTGVGETLIAFPDEALERAARWCRALDQSALLDLRSDLIESLRRAAEVTEDLGGAVPPDLLGEPFGPVTLSAPRWVDLDVNERDSALRLFDYLADRLVKPPKPVVYGGGATAGEKLAKDLVLPAVRSRFPNARLAQPLVGRSGREFVADVFAEGARPLVLSTVVVGSTSQGIHALEAKAFQLFDVGRSFANPTLAACCIFPAIDPKRVREDAEKIFGSIDVQVVTPENVAEAIPAA